MTVNLPIQVLPPPPGSPRWTVDIPMPRFETGPKRGQLVGWLQVNRPPAHKGERIEHTEIRRLWRQSSYQRLAAIRVSRNLDRIFLLVQYQFADHTKRDLPNFELTAKPCIDALQPNRVEVRRHKTKAGGVRLTTVHHQGWGVIPDDNRRHLIRGPEQDVLPPLGRSNPIGGWVILHITQYPEQLEMSA